jgi:hypothetical protein
MSVLNTCIVIRLYYKNIKIEQLSPWISFLFLKLMPVMLFMKKKKIGINKSSLYLSAKMLPSFKNENNNCPNMNSPSCPPNENTLFSDFYNLKNRKNSPLICTRKKALMAMESNKYQHFIKELNYNKNLHSYHDLLLANEKSTINRKSIFNKKQKETTLANNDSNNQTNKKIMYRQNSTLYNINVLKNSFDLPQKIVENTNMVGPNKKITDRSTNNDARFAPSKSFPYFSNQVTPKRNKEPKHSPSFSDKKLYSSSASLTFNRKKIFTLESISPSENLTKACESIDYISEILKEKAQMEKVCFD